MGPIGKDKLVFDTGATLVDNDNVGAYLRGADGTLITHTNEGGKDALDVHLSNASIVVTATDLDIRDLSHTQDSVKIGDGVDFLAVNADGSINVNADISVVNGSDKAEDSASASGDIGTYMLSVRQDALATSTSTDGDYQSFKTDSVGSLWVHVSQSVAPAAPNTAFTAATVAVDDTAGGTALVASPLANRKKLLIQNLGNKPIYVGPTGVTAASGIRVAAGGNWEIEAGPSIAVFAITATATAVDVRVFELA